MYSKSFTIWHLPVPGSCSARYKKSVIKVLYTVPYTAQFWGHVVYLNYSFILIPLTKISMKYLFNVTNENQ